MELVNTAMRLALRHSGCVLCGCGGPVRKRYMRAMVMDRNFGVKLLGSLLACDWDGWWCLRVDSSTGWCGWLNFLHGAAVDRLSENRGRLDICGAHVSVL